MSFEFIKLHIDGLYEIRPKVFGDSRGYFLEAYSEKDFVDAGLNVKFVQDNLSKSSKNVLRGLHFQKKHPQAKLIQCISGKVYDVAVDLRKDSPTFGKYHGVILDSKKHNMFYIPQGFAHGYVALEDCVISYKCSDFYHPEDEAGVLWNSQELGIDWEAVCPGITECAVLSEKDRMWPEFEFGMRNAKCAIRNW